MNCSVNSNFKFERVLAEDQQLGYDIIYMENENSKNKLGLNLKYFSRCSSTRNRNKLENT